MSNDVDRILEKALEILNDGENWCKGDLQIGHRYCVIGAFNQAVLDIFGIDKSDAWQHGTVWHGTVDALTRLDKAMPFGHGYFNIPCFNDDPKTTWEDINLLFKKAISDGDSV